MILHIFNGDIAADAWLKCGNVGDYLVWRENYLEGPLLPAETPNAEFERARAEFLHGYVPEYSAERLWKFLLHLDNTAESLAAGDTAVLWFDFCMFDQVMLARILYLLRHTSAEVRLLCEDAALGEAPELLCRDPRSFRRLSDEAIRTYSTAWLAILGGAAAIERFNAEACAAAEPILQAAMIRYGEDHPASGGLGKSERRLLRLLRENPGASFDEIFRTFNKMEAHPFMGDTMCRRMLESLKSHLTPEEIENAKTALY